MNRFMKSLLAKYMLIIITAILLLQVAFLLVGTIALFGLNDTDNTVNDTKIVEDNWHRDANNLKIVSEDEITLLFMKWKEEYPNAGMFWVNGEGKLQVVVDATDELPETWTPGDAIYFAKQRYGGDPFTVIAYPNEQIENGFIVIEIPRTVFDPPIMKVSEEYGYFILIGVIGLVLVFILISFLFFRSIQKRLINLQDAMGIRDTDGLPVEVKSTKEDEIGRLELSFNQMVKELRESRRREQQEEQLRRELIANLSHDLRTPLTKIRAQVHTIVKNEELTVEGTQAVKAIETSIGNIDQLIENLMSYTLLMASKYKYNPEQIDITRLVRESMATWYPVFEKESFTVDVDLQSLGTWEVDSIWMGRILDNLFQNVLRHANSGKYLQVKSEINEYFEEIIIRDHGPGFKDDSQDKGAGIGLTIVDMMVKGMNLEWDIESSENGTTIRIKRKREHS